MADKAELAENFDFIRFTLTDINGISRSKTLPSKVAKKRLKDGIHVLVHLAVAGPMGELPSIPQLDKLCNVALKPDMSTLHAVPSAENSKFKVGEVLCETYWLETGDPMQCCPRAVARKQLDRLDEMGYRFMSSAELEFCLMNAETGKPVFDYNNMLPTLGFIECDELMYKIHQEAEKSGMQVEGMHAEGYPGLYEAYLIPEWDIKGADYTFIFRQLIKELAMRHTPRLEASFITLLNKENAGGNMSQLNHSLWRKATNPEIKETSAFYDSSNEDNLSDTARWWIGGLVKHTKAMMAFYLSTVHCYRAFPRGCTWTPRASTWGMENRKACYRVKAWSPECTSIECRLCGPLSNPYLTMAATVAAGIDGIKNRLEAPPQVDKDAHELPKTLEEALKALEDDKDLVEALGEEFVQWFITSKRQIDLEKLKTSDPTNEDDEEGWENEKKYYRNL